MRTSNTKCFLKGLPIVAACLGDKLGVQIKLGNTACTDGRTIVLPVNIDEKKINKEELLGFVVHEAGHIRYTDMQCWKNRDPSPLLRSLANAIEDSRIERLMIKKYAGAQYLLRCAHDPCLEEYLKPAYKPNEASALGLYCITATSAMFRDGLAVKVRDVMRGWCVRYFGERTTAAVDAELSNFFKFKSVYDVIACSERIISLLKKRAVCRENLRPTEGEGHSATGKTDAEVGNHDTETSKEANQAAAKAAAAALEAKPEEIDTSDLSENGQEKLQDAADLSGQVEQTPFKVDWRNPISPDKVLLFGNMGYEFGRKRLAEAKVNSARLRRAMTGIIQAKSHEGVYTAASGRRLQASRLSRLISGSTQVFERREETQNVDTAVSVLLDLSGSTGVAGGNLAIQSALSLITALQTVPKVKTALTVFPAVALRGDAWGDNMSFIKKEPCINVLPFGERLEKRVQLIGCLESLGATPLTETLARSCKVLSQRPEKRKVVIVITDGAIRDNSNSVLECMRRWGIEVAAVGIGLDSSDDEEYFRQAFPIYALLDDFAQLPAALMNIGTQLMTQKH